VRIVIVFLIATEGEIGEKVLIRGCNIVLGGGSLGGQRLELARVGIQDLEERAGIEAGIFDGGDLERGYIEPGLFVALHQEPPEFLHCAVE